MPADSAIKTPADMKGKKVAFTAPTSNSGFKAPSALLQGRIQSRGRPDFTPVFSGKHDNSVLGVANKDYDAAAIANEVMFRMFERKVVDQGQDQLNLQVGDFSDDRLRPCLQSRSEAGRKDQAGVFHLPWEGSALKAEFKSEDRFVPITYQKDWSVIRKIDAANGVKYTCK